MGYLNEQRLFSILEFVNFRERERKKTNNWGEISDTKEAGQSGDKLGFVNWNDGFTIQLNDIYLLLSHCWLISWLPFLSSLEHSLILFLLFSFSISNLLFCRPLSSPPNSFHCTFYEILIPIAPSHSFPVLGDVAGWLAGWLAGWPAGRDD